MDGQTGIDDLIYMAARPRQQPTDLRAARIVRFRIDLHRLILGMLSRNVDSAPVDRRERARTTLVTYASQCRQALDALPQTVIPAAMPSSGYLREQYAAIDNVLAVYRGG